MRDGSAAPQAERSRRDRLRPARVQAAATSAGRVALLGARGELFKIEALPAAAARGAPEDAGAGQPRRARASRRWRRLARAPRPLRAAGAAAFARPGGGPADALPAAAAGEGSRGRGARRGGGWPLRASGDLANDYVLPLLKARESQPLVAMAPELGKQTSAGSWICCSRCRSATSGAARAGVRGAGPRTDAAGRAVYQPLAATVKRIPTPRRRRAASSTPPPTLRSSSP